MNKLTSVELQDDNDAVYTQLRLDGMADFAKFNSMFSELTRGVDCWDGYGVSGDMINDFISTFPPLADAWNSMSPREKWIFVEAMFYGIHSFVFTEMGFRQVA